MMMMRYYVYFVIELLLDTISKLGLSHPPTCQRCDFPPAPAWKLVTRDEQRKSIPVEHTPGTPLPPRPIVVHNHGWIEAMSDQQADRLRKALDELADQHRRWVLYQSAQSIDSQIAPALLAVCEKEAARL